MNEKSKPIFHTLDTLAPAGMMQVKTRDGATAARPVYDSNEVKRALLARFIDKRKNEKSGEPERDQSGQ